jgi:hypothetical protein
MKNIIININGDGNYVNIHNNDKGNSSKKKTKTKNIIIKWIKNIINKSLKWVWKIIIAIKLFFG